MNGPVIRDSIRMMAGFLLLPLIINGEIDSQGIPDVRGIIAWVGEFPIGLKGGRTN